MGKGENAGNQHFLIFPQHFLLFQKQISVFQSHLPSENVLNLGQSNILLFGKQLIAKAGNIVRKGENACNQHFSTVHIVFSKGVYPWAFRHIFASAEACEESSRWLCKESYVNTGMRKPGNTCGFSTSMI